jgi:hypothetical protein
MRRSKLLVLAAVLGSACTHAAPLAPPAPPAPPAVASAPEPSEPSMETSDPDTTADPQTVVLVMEADDLGGDLDAIVAPPKRAPLPSMMTDVAMAPSH